MNSNLLRNTCLAALAFLATSASGAERQLDFNAMKLNEAPPGFRSVVTGQGKPGEWRILQDEVPSSIPSLTPNAPVPRRGVLAQISRDPTDEHTPLLILDDEVYGDFTITTRFKTVAGVIEQMAGIAFRIQDEKNYYYVRASSIGNTFRFYKMVGGERSAPIGVDIEIPKGVWHDLSIECRGNQIRCKLNGKEAFPALTDTSYSSGKVGFWTKSDSVSYFADTRIVYTPREALASVLVREMKEKFPRLKGLKIYGYKSADRASFPVIVASTVEGELGKPGTDVEKEVIATSKTFAGRGTGMAITTFPLHDRNGDVVGALRLEMTPFAGQTEQNLLGRAMPIVDAMQKRIMVAEALF